MSLQIPKPLNDSVRLPEPALLSDQLISQLRVDALALGFSSIGVTNLDVSQASKGLKAWLAQGFHGSMDYMARHEMLRSEPGRLVEGAVTAIMVTMPYTPSDAEGATDATDWLAHSWQTIATPDQAYVARYALGRDYHKVVRGALAALAQKTEERLANFGYRVFCDSAPVMEVELARKANLGWRGKHTLLLSREQGSMFFIGTIYTTVPLSPEATVDNVPTPNGQHCGSCQRCIEVCPTQAIVAPYQLDARKCISYLTIENKNSIPVEYRRAIGNRIYGCDDCQLVCPWNKYAQAAASADFSVRNDLDTASLLTLFSWTQEEFETRVAGSAIYRIGYWRWLRNIAVGLGNALYEQRKAMGNSDGAQGNVDIAELTQVLLMRKASCDAAIEEQAMLLEHIDWALS